MEDIKTKGIEKLENIMDQVDASSLRYEVLRNAKNFKTSWIGLGQILYKVWKDKLYKDWGFMDFEAYTKKEIGIYKNTALKLLRSYSFLEKEEPGYIQQDPDDIRNKVSVPNYEAVDLLRKAANNNSLDREDYSKIRKYVLDDGKEVKEVKKDLTQMMKQRAELEPQEARQKRREAIVKRYIGVLRSVSKEIRASNMLPADIVKDVEFLIEKIESEIS